ncbi:lanthionine synthetase C family protein [Actinacidiphila yeochonensis]|uniref:lanthionine synthetase C family protein n=1 Tax=Actinacidiphila yeochonensis TaxID=89050 RepID=UPI0006900E7B|nr:lanthionine synthetase C family protein [Actinacidiphila yeochonensis]
MTQTLSTTTSLSFRQSLAHGPLGTALPAIEQARRGTGTWEKVHQSLSGLGPLIDGPAANLYLGAPATAFVLHLAADGTSRYSSALRALDTIVAAHTRRRLDAAHARINAGRQTEFAEYDLFRGLTGIGAGLLLRQPHSPELKGVLEYLVRLTEPLPAGGELSPGWWVGHAPTSHTAATPGGHANAGMAHGIAGPLALLALTMRAGITVDGHEAAIHRVCRWLDRIRQHDHRGVHWPRWVSEDGPAPALPAAPSWCYGTPGLARAQQLAGIVTEDADRTRMAERALLHCLLDPAQLDQIAGRGLCHGFAGIMRTAQRVAQDSASPAPLVSQLQLLRDRLLTADVPEEDGFLEGVAGAALAFQDADSESDYAAQGQWDACLLLT